MKTFTRAFFSMCTILIVTLTTVSAEEKPLELQKLDNEYEATLFAIGINGHWLACTNLKIGYSLHLFYKGENIITYYPDSREWWMTGFNPYYQNVKADDLEAGFTLFLPSEGMFRTFLSRWDSDPRCGTLQWVDLQIGF